MCSFLGPFDGTDNHLHKSNRNQSSYLPSLTLLGLSLEIKSDMKLKVL